MNEKGNTTHIYRKVSNVLISPSTNTPASPQPSTSVPDKGRTLPNTGEASSSASVIGTEILGMAAVVLAGKRCRNED